MGVRDISVELFETLILNSESPLWMQEKLRRSGLRSIDPVVDVTNFVLIELGQPMHAFDYSKLEGQINVRMAKENEKLVLLDGKEVNLSSEIMLIADSNKTGCYGRNYGRPGDVCNRIH